MLRARVIKSSALASETIQIETRLDGLKPEFNFGDLMQFLNLRISVKTTFSLSSHLVLCTNQNRGTMMSLSLALDMDK